VARIPTALYSLYKNYLSLAHVRCLFDRMLLVPLGTRRAANSILDDDLAPGSFSILLKASCHRLLNAPHSICHPEATSVIVRGLFSLPCQTKSQLQVWIMDNMSEVMKLWYML